MRQQMLPTIEPSENDLVEFAMAEPLLSKIDKAVALLKLYEYEALKRSDDGYWLAYSGGKDSNCILELAKMAGVKYRPVYNVTTIDAPELVRYIKTDHPEVEFNRPRVSMMTRMVERTNGPPTRLSRWCCEEYKERGGKGMVKVIGVRAAESPRRKALWHTVMPQQKNGISVCPILYWADADVWEFHRLRTLTYCKLYDEGFSRLGCVGCPLAGVDNMKKEFARWPKIEQGWRRAVDRFWDSHHGTLTKLGKTRWFEKLGSAQGVWDWWLRQEPENGEECQGLGLYT